MLIKNNNTLRRVLSEFNLPEQPDEFELDDDLAHWIDGAHEQQTHVEDYEHREAIGVARALSHKRNEELRAMPVAQPAAAASVEYAPPVWAAEMLRVLTQIRDNTARQTESPISGRTTLGILAVLVILILTVIAAIK